MNKNSIQATPVRLFSVIVVCVVLETPDIFLIFNTRVVVLVVN